MNAEVNNSERAMKLSDWQTEETKPTIFGLYQVMDDPELYAYYGEWGWCTPAYVGGKEQAYFQYKNPIFKIGRGPYSWRGLVDE